MLKELKYIRKLIADNASRSLQGDVSEKWTLDALQRLDALIDNLMASQTHPENDDNFYNQGMSELDLEWERQEKLEMMDLLSSRDYILPKKHEHL